MTTKKIVVGLFAWLAIGAKDCTGWGWSNNGYEGYATGSGSGGPICPQGMGGAGGASTGSGMGGGAGGGGPGPTPQGLTCGSVSTDPFAGVDPETLNREVLRASALASYLAGMLSSSGVDPSNQAALAALFAQDAPMAQSAVDKWLATLDPSTIPAAGVEPKGECTDLGCPYRAKCSSVSFVSPPPPYTCLVVGCGIAKCTSCPDYWPDIVKDLVLTSWCAYVCIGQNVSPPPVVALGAVGIDKRGNPYPSATTAFCYPEP